MTPTPTPYSGPATTTITRNDVRTLIRDGWVDRHDGALALGGNRDAWYRCERAAVARLERLTART